MKKNCDMLIGCRGGSWYAFSNSPAGSLAIRNRDVAVGFSTKNEAIQACVRADLTWEMEE